MSRGLGKMERLILEKLSTIQSGDYSPVDGFPGNFESAMRAVRGLEKKGFVECTTLFEYNGQKGVRLKGRVLEYATLKRDEFLKRLNRLQYKTQIAEKESTMAINKWYRYKKRVDSMVEELKRCVPGEATLKEVTYYGNYSRFIIVDESEEEKG